MLSFNSVACERGERQLFSGLNYELAARTLFEVRGANGSGKSSLLRMLCGLLTPSAGTISWRGTLIDRLGEQYRGQIAYLGHASGVKDELTACENVQFSAHLASLPADAAGAITALASFGLESHANQTCKTLSQGQRRRVALARLRLSAARPLWILDEPFTALDAHAVQLTQALIESHVDQGGIVVLTTHQDVAIKAPVVQCIELPA